MKIEKKTVVSLTYTLKVDAGDVVDQTTESAPFVFIHGVGQTLEEFDKNLTGLQAGDDFQFSISPEKGYGVHSEEMIVPVAREIFNVPEAPADLLNLGNTIPMRDQSGNAMYGKVLQVDEEKVLMDFNHPLAGEQLHFTGKIVSVRPATEDELSHGHVHGDGGVHH